jgi:membrane protein required for colicin V production
MSSIDYLILGLIVISALIGIWRGFVREALSLLIWAAAFWLAYAGATVLEVYLAGMISDQALRLAVSFVALFLTVHIVGFIISRLLSTVIKSVGLRGVDRVAGAGFGLVRGVVVVAVVVLLVGMTPMAQEATWQQSYMVGAIKQMLTWLQMNYPLDQMGQAVVGMNGELF